MFNIYTEQLELIKQGFATAQEALDEALRIKRSLKAQAVCVYREDIVPSKEFQKIVRLEMNGFRAHRGNYNSKKRAK